MFSLRFSIMFQLCFNYDLTMVLRWREIRKLQIEFACVVRMSEMDLAGHTPVKFTYKENFWNPASLKNLWQHRSQARVPLLICQRSGTVFRPWETTCLVLFAFVRIHPEWSTSIIDWPKIEINFLLSAMLDLPCPSIAYRASDRCLCGIEGEGVCTTRWGSAAWQGAILSRSVWIRLPHLEVS